MKIGTKRVLICNCERTMPLDGAGLARALSTEQPVVHSQLCRAQIDAYRRAVGGDRDRGDASIEGAGGIRGGGEGLIVCCTQEAPLFREVAAEVAPDAEPALVNIRETAGWSEQGGRASAKIAALIAEAAVTVEPTPTVTFRSDGVTLVYGRGQGALEAARRLRGRLNVTCLLADPGDAEGAPVMDVPVFTGRIRSAGGHLGAFELTVDGFAPYAPSSRESLRFHPARDGVSSTCDVILDLSGRAPLFPATAKRDGYVRAEPSDAVGIERALFDVCELVGEFEKPRYLRVDPALCAHSRNQIVGCTKCLDVCPSGAITPAGDHTAVDPHVCSGHGTCASVCPTGAIVFDLPRGDALFERLRVLMRTYREAGGEPMVLLVHDPRDGWTAISAMARAGRGLPANVVPFAVNEITQAGLDFFLTALAYGAAQIRVLAGPEHRDALDPLRGQATVVDAVMAGLGFGGDRLLIEDERDPDALQDRLGTPPPPPLGQAARHAALGDKRTVIGLALDHLHARAPRPVECVTLPEGSPFGLVQLDLERCTLCLACVGACPTGALGDNPDHPRLTFTEAACVQCGLCRNTCPEDAIALAPRLNFAASAKTPVVLKEEPPFACIRCGTLFASQSVIHRLVERMAGHSMFADGNRLDLIKMCEDCRIQAQFNEDAPLAMGTRPVPRTTDDYLRERGAGGRTVGPAGSDPGRPVNGGNGSGSDRG